MLRQYPMLYINQAVFLLKYDWLPWNELPMAAAYCLNVFALIFVLITVCLRVCFFSVNDWPSTISATFIYVCLYLQSLFYMLLLFICFSIWRNIFKIDAYMGNFLPDKLEYVGLIFILGNYLVYYHTFNIIFIYIRTHGISVCKYHEFSYCKNPWDLCM